MQLNEFSIFFPILLQESLEERILLRLWLVIFTDTDFDLCFKDLIYELFELFDSAEFDSFLYGDLICEFAYNLGQIDIALVIFDSFNALFIIIQCEA